MPGKFGMLQFKRTKLKLMSKKKAGDTPPAFSKKYV